MNINKLFKYALIWAVVVMFSAQSAAFAQTIEEGPTSGQNKTFNKKQLDQMLAPIALYPDSLLAQILMAATFPTQVVEADRWVKDHKGLSKDQLNAKLDKKNWDLSVKALVPFPRVLSMMDKHLDWTTNLGQAFLDQESDVMASVQELRHKAYAAGNFKSNKQQRVVVRGNNIKVEPAKPDVVYVPYYNPQVVYGNWWWPDYQPYNIYPGGEPYVTLGPFGFLAGITVGPYWHRGWGRWDWDRRDIDVNVNRYANINADNPAILHRMRTARFHRLEHRRALHRARIAQRRSKLRAERRARLEQRRNAARARIAQRRSKLQAERRARLEQRRNAARARIAQRRSKLRAARMAHHRTQRRIRLARRR